jgi:hypothetical protein
VGPNQQIRKVCTVTVESEHMLNINILYIYIYNSLVGTYSNVFCMPRKGEI